VTGVFLRFRGAEPARRAALPGALVLLGALLAAPVSAQTQTAAPPKLTLRAALQLAEQRNPDLLAARQTRAISQAGVKIAGEIPNPVANFDVMRDTPHESLYFDQTLELGGKRKRRIELARQRVGVTEEQISDVARQVRFEVRGAYYALGLARGRTRLQQQRLALARRLAQIARERYTSGDVARLEVMQADLGVTRAQAAAQLARQQERIALGELNALLDEPGATDWSLVDRLNGPLPALSLQQLLQKAYEKNPRIAQFRRQELVQERQTALYRAERIPNLDLQFGADFNTPGPGGFSVGPRGHLGIALPFFTREQGQLAQSLAAERWIENELFAERRRVTGAVERSYLELDARQAEVDVYHTKLVPAAHELEKMSEESYRAGKANILAVLDAQRSVRQVEGEYLDSLFAAQQALGALEDAVGAPLE
jgi:outer membrane protein, heavy metal efflux system